LTDIDQLDHESPKSTALSTTAPLVFISHDSRDAALAEAFGKLLKSVSAGMIRTFRSSDKKGTDGIDFGDEWYKRLMTKLDSTSDVVCLFTERSIDRPWILFEAGVAKGKLSTPVIGVALGIPLSSISTGPFYQFQNMDDSEADLSKLVHQLAKRVPGLELDPGVVKSQIAEFKNSEVEILKKMAANPLKKTEGDENEATAVAKILEEMKALPSRVAARMSEPRHMREVRHTRRLSPRMLFDLLSGLGPDPASVLVVAGMIRDEVPWLYELMMEVYRALRSDDRQVVKDEIDRLERISEISLRGPWMEYVADTAQARMLIVEVPQMLKYALERSLAEPKPARPTRRKKSSR
jgi:hypothetical protein